MKALLLAGLVLGLAAVGCAGSAADKPVAPEYQSCRCGIPASVPGGSPVVGAPQLYCWRGEWQTDLATTIARQMNTPPPGSTESGNAMCTCMEAVGQDCSCQFDGDVPPQYLSAKPDTALCQAR